MQTIGSVLDRYKGIGPGFDFLRVALALTIVFNHSFLIVEGSYDTVDRWHLWAVFGAGMPMFFSLSGFLITGSAGRLKLKDFLLNRSLRIVPALAVDIFVSALAIGTLVTIVPLADYFSDKKFSHYFLNIVGFIHYQLPGVFLFNPFPDQVNGSLWTVPYEIGCYIIMSALIVTGAVKSKSRMLIAVTGCIFAWFALHFYFIGRVSPFDGDGALDHYVNNFISSRGNYLYFYFSGGALLYVFRYHVPYSGKLALALAALVMAQGAGLLPLGIWKPVALALPVSYLVAYIGLLPVKKLPLYSRGDYSYGIYLYAYPLQQLLVMLFPGKFSVVTHFICSAALVTCVAMLSWHGVEKPILKIRKKFSFTARKGDEKVVLPKDTSSPSPSGRGPG